MSLIIENKWRRVMLTLLLLSMLGPWTFDLLNVPAQFPCQRPSVRLYGDFCGYPMSGFGSIIWVLGGFFYLLNELIMGNGAGVRPDFIALLFVWIIVFPLVSTFLLLGKKISRRLQFLNLAAGVLACLVSITMFIFQSYRDQFGQFFYLLWGLLLYIPVAISVVIFELLALRSGNTTGNPNTEPPLYRTREQN